VPPVALLSAICEEMLSLAIIDAFTILLQVEVVQIYDGFI
jgi:hypothetical protein